MSYIESLDKLTNAFRSLPGVGYKTAQNYYEASIDEFSAADLETYYAEVKEVNERTLTVKGLSINEEKYQGESQYEISGQVTIVQGNEIITLLELEQGDIVSIILITGEGHVKGITDAFKILNGNRICNSAVKIFFASYFNSF